MSDQPASGNSAAAIWITGLCAALVLYVLSPVAVGALIEKGFVSEDSPMLAVYAPIAFAAEHFPFIGNFYDWLFERCGVEWF